MKNQFLKIFTLLFILFTGMTYAQTFTVTGGIPWTLNVTSNDYTPSCGTSPFFASGNQDILFNNNAVVTITSSQNLGTITIPILTVGSASAEYHNITVLDVNGNTIPLSNLTFTKPCDDSQFYFESVPATNTMRIRNLSTTATNQGAVVITISSTTAIKSVKIINSGSSFYAAAFSVNTSHYSGTLYCAAGTNMPNLNAATNFASNIFTIPCGNATANLSTLTASNNPGTLPITWHSGATATNTNKITATALATGTYYAAFWDSTNACYSPTRVVTVTEANCLTLGNDSLNGTAGTASTTASVLANDTNNGAAVTVGSTGNSTLTWQTAAPAGITLNADGTISIGTTAAAGTYNITYQVCDKTVPTNCKTATATVIVAAACTAGTNAPSLTNATNFASNTFTIPCGSTAANLSTLTASNNPGTLPITWHSATPATDGNKITATALAAGTYYAAFYDSTNTCYSPTQAVTVTEANCLTLGNDSLNGIVGTASTTASVFANDTNNGAAVTVGATGNSTLTWQTAAPAGITLNADGTISIGTTAVAGTYPITYQICDKTVPTNCSTATATVTVAAAATCNAGTVAPNVN